MKNRWVISLACIVLIGFQPACADELGDAVRKAISRVAESTLRIRTVGNSTEASGISSQVTTGVSISDDGYVLSSTFGFPSTAAAVFVEDADGQRVAAKLVARDSLRQLVLLKCESGRFVVPKLAAERWPDVGAYAISAGRLYDSSSPTLSVGVVSAVNRVFGMALQTDAKISPVNYGGPLVNLDGEVMGILVPLSPRATGDGLAAGVEWYDSGIGFAIPARDMVEAAKRLRDGTDRVRGVMGVGLTTRNPLSPIVQVGNVLPGSPADEAGLKSADFIVEANGTKIDRVGIFDSVVKSSYAGDVLDLRVKTGKDVRSVAVELTDKLVRPERGYLGIVLLAEAAKKQGADAVVRAVVVPDSPAAKAIDSDLIQIVKLNGKTVESRKQLATEFKRIVPGQELKLTVLPTSEAKELQEQVDEKDVGKKDSQAGDAQADDAQADDDQPSDDQPSEVLITAISRTETFPEVSDEFTKAAAPISQFKNWKQSEENFEELGKAWIYAPDLSAKAGLGMLILLSDSTTDNDRVLSQWSEICQERGLILLVPKNVEKTELTAEDRALIRKSVGFVAKKYLISGDRRIVVTDSEQAALTGDFLLETEQRIAGAAVFLQSWPQTTAVTAESLAAASLKMLLVEGKAISRQQQALFGQAMRDLREARAWLTVLPSEAGLPPIAKTIADWFVLQQAL
ncbi:MAG: trypsin-like peptidase domain-containing protein [Fuerstiella sp.]